MSNQPRAAVSQARRARRRELANITPMNSHPQTQSALFAVLPSEIRDLIFTYAVCQDRNLSAPVSQESHRGRPGHEHNVCTDTSLLRTCRRIYYETRAIPPRSTTHHMYSAPNESFNPRDWDHHLFHLSSQIGQDIYHLHVIKWKSPFTFYRYFRDHLHWKKLTWTFCASEWTRGEMGRHFHISQTLQDSRIPNSCHEVTVEYESLLNFPFQRMLLRECGEECAALQLLRNDGSSLHFDAAKSAEYTWEGKTFKPPSQDDNSWEGRYVDATYHVIRICWRDEVPEREYMRYDRVDCLQSSAIRFMSSEDILKDREALATR